MFVITLGFGPNPIFGVHFLRKQTTELNHQLFHEVWGAKAEANTSLPLSVCEASLPPACWVQGSMSSLFRFNMDLYYHLPSVFGWVVGTCRGIGFMKRTPICQVRFSYSLRASFAAAGEVKAVKAPPDSSCEVVLQGSLYHISKPLRLIYI